MQKLKNQLTSGRRVIPVILSGVVLVSAILTNGFHVLAASCTNTADCQQQINNLNSQISQSKGTLSQLTSQAQSYEAAKDQLQSQITALQSQIQANEAEQASLQSQIAAAEQQLAQQKSVLGNDLKQFYIGGQTTPIEMLATSSNLSDYVDKQEAYTALQNTIQTTLKKIASLQATLQEHKTQVDQLVTTEQTQNTQLTSAEAQEQQLLSYNQSQQAAYNQQIASSQSNVSQLRARLSALNDAAGSTIVASGTCGGGYPAKAVNPYAPGDGFGPYWGCNYAQDASEDNWHMENRECVSYTAYMAFTKYGVSASKWGNAYQWITAAEGHGYTVNQTPSAGSIAIRNRDYSEAGDVGHAMYVVSVSGSNITVDEYNEHYNGQFDERTFNPDSYDDRGGMYYIHFN